MEPIRTLQVLSVMNRGGAETIVMTLYRSIDRSKIQFDFVLHSEVKGDYDDEIRALGGRLFYMPRFSLKSAVSYVRAWDKFFNEHPEYRVIHGHIRSTASIYLSIARKHGLFTIAHSHSTSSGTGMDGFFKNLLQIPLKGNFIDQLFACSEDSGRWLFGSRNMHRVTIIKNPIEARKFEYNQIVRNHKRAELGFGQRFVVGHVGRFDEPKNHAFLLDIFAAIHRRDAEALLILVGRGDLEPQMKEKAAALGLADNVRFLGVRADVAELMQAMDVFLFPSLHEGLPVAVLEAQAAGLPCIISDSITDEVCVCPTTQRLKLSSGAQIWSDTVLACKNKPRENTGDYIRQSGFDIGSTVNEMTEFYLKASGVS